MVYVEWSALYVKDVFVTVASVLLWRENQQPKMDSKEMDPSKI